MLIQAKARLMASMVTDQLANVFFTELKKRSPYFSKWSIGTTLGPSLAPPSLPIPRYEQLLPQVEAALKTLGWVKKKANEDGTQFVRQGTEWPLLFNKYMLSLQLQGDRVAHPNLIPGLKEVLRDLKRMGVKVDVHDQNLKYAQTQSFSAHTKDPEPLVQVIKKALAKFGAARVYEKENTGVDIWGDGDRVVYILLYLGDKVLVKAQFTHVNRRDKA